ncbi:MAG: hypothetical protein LBV23_03820, partial [Deltaproteobacteria bacterium]|nr:hypothetical protein [Deltaproteobacteria bacterium]
SNAAEDTPAEKFTELALRRWPIEQCFEECKSDLGLDHYEGRFWIGWRRHFLIVFVVHLFLQLMRGKFSVNFDDLSEQRKEVYKAVNEREDDSKITIDNRKLTHAV